MRGTSITNRLPPNTWCARRRTWHGSSSIAGRGTTSSSPSGCATARWSSAACRTIARHSTIAPGRESTRPCTRGALRRRKRSATTAATSTGGSSVTTSRRGRGPYAWIRRHGGAAIAPRVPHTAAAGSLRRSGSEGRRGRRRGAPGRGRVVDARSDAADCATRRTPTTRRSC